MRTEGEKRHGLTVRQRDALLASQDGRCAACRKPISRKQNGDFGGAVDHDHSCCPGPHSCGNCTRGILCFDCNLSLGFAKDDISILASLIAYLNDRSLKATKEPPFTIRPIADGGLPQLVDDLNAVMDLNPPFRSARDIRLRLGWGTERSTRAYRAATKVSLSA